MLVAFFSSLEEKTLSSFLLFLVGSASIYLFFPTFDYTLLTGFLTAICCYLLLVHSAKTSTPIVLGLLVAVMFCVKFPSAFVLTFVVAAYLVTQSKSVHKTAAFFISIGAWVLLIELSTESISAILRTFLESQEVTLGHDISFLMLRYRNQLLELALYSLPTSLILILIRFCDDTPKRRVILGFSLVLVCLLLTLQADSSHFAYVYLGLLISCTLAFLPLSLTSALRHSLILVATLCSQLGTNADLVLYSAL